MGTDSFTVDWQSHLEAFPCATWIGDSDGGNTYVNLAYRRLLGVVNLQLVTGRGWEQYVHPEDQADYVAAWDHFVPTQRLSPEDAIRFVEMIPALRIQLAAQGVRLVGGNEYLERILASSRNLRVPVADCSPGQRFLFIDESGRASPCSFTSEILGVAMSSLRSSSALLQLPNQFHAARNRLRPLACNDCLSTQVCQKFSFQSS